MDIGNEMQTYHITEQFDENVWDEMVRAVLPNEGYLGWYRKLKKHVPLDYMWEQYFNKVGSITVYFNKNGEWTEDSNNLFDFLHDLHNDLEIAERKRINQYRQNEIDDMKSMPNFGLNAKDDFYRFSFLMNYKKEYGEEALWKMIMPDYKPFNFMDCIKNG